MKKNSSNQKFKVIAIAILIFSAIIGTIQYQKNLQKEKLSAYAQAVLESQDANQKSILLNKLSILVQQQGLAKNSKADDWDNFVVQVQACVDWAWQMSNPLSLASLPVYQQFNGEFYDDFDAAFEYCARNPDIVWY